MAKNTKGLGKGLDALFNSPSVSIKDTPATTASGDGIRTVKIGKVEPNRDQPRKVFDENDINELASSIKDHGILQPILVTDRGDHFEIIAGERRWRAANVAGLKEVPVIVKDLTEEEIYIISLLENLQRKDLNPIDEAQAYKRLIDDYGFKQDEVAEKVYKSRTEVTNKIRLLKLPEKVRQMVIDGTLSTGHARALLSIEDEKSIEETAEKIVAQKLSVRDVEKLVKSLGNPAKKPRAKKANKNSFVYEDIENRLKQTLGTKVSISAKDGGAGKIEIEFFSDDDLERILEIIG